jgi:GNAT superfamily N-acetyltransferase
MKVEPLSPKHKNAWLELFRRAESPCFCRFWHFEGDKNAWLDRCANHPELSEEEAHFDHALVAAHDDRIVGHMMIAPRASLPKLKRLPVYRSLVLGPDEGVWSIGCMLVDPEARHRGVARALVEAAPAYVASHGGRIVEAYPRHPIDRLRDDEAWMGPESLFHACGFNTVHHEGAYMVVRRNTDLTSSGSGPPAM